MFSSFISVVSSENSESAEYFRMYEQEVLATDVGSSSMVVDPLGHSHYTYISNDNELTYLTDSSGDWESSLVYTGDVYEHVIASDSQGNVHIAFSAGEWNDPDLVYKTNKGGWDAEVIDKELFVTGATIDIALDNEDNVHIAYIESSEKSTNQMNYEDQYINRLKYAKIGEDGTWVSSYVHDENYSIDVEYPTISAAAGYVFFGYSASFYDEEYSWFSDSIAVDQQGDEYNFGSSFQMEDSHINTRQSSVAIEGLKIYTAFYSHSLQKLELSICDIGTFSCSLREIATSGAPNNWSQIDVVPNEGRLHLIYSEIVPKEPYDGITTIHWSCNLDQQGECNGDAPESRSIAWTSVVGWDEVNTGPSQLWYSDVLDENANIGIKSNQVEFSGTIHNGDLILYREVFKLNGCRDSSAENYDPAATVSVTTDLYSGCTYPPMQEKEPLAQDEGLPGFQISTFILAFTFAIFYRKQ